jgi:hypothetical protein
MRATLGVNVNAAAPPKSQPFVEPMTTGHGINVKQLNTPTERFRNLSKVIWLGRRVLLAPEIERPPRGGLSEIRSGVLDQAAMAAVPSAS